MDINVHREMSHMLSVYSPRLLSNSLNYEQISGQMRMGRSFLEKTQLIMANLGKWAGPENNRMALAKFSHTHVLRRITNQNVYEHSMIADISNEGLLNNFQSNNFFKILLYRDFLLF